MPDDRRDREHQFGGKWTTVKLKVLSHYLQSYTTALKKTRFHKLYIDAFAGTGYRDMRRDNEEESPQNVLFPDLAEPAPQAFLDDSARWRFKSIHHSISTSSSSAGPNAAISLKA